MRRKPFPQILVLVQCLSSSSSFQLYDMINNEIASYTCKGVPWNENTIPIRTQNTKFWIDPNIFAVTTTNIGSNAPGRQ